jgi:hypothetical protein
MAASTPTKASPKGKAEKPDDDESGVSKDAFVEPIEGDDNVDGDAPVAGTVVEEDDTEAEMEKLEPLADPKRWIIGKPPEHGGTEKTYSIYTQDVLGYFPRLRFYALVANTIAKAMKAGAEIDVPGLEPSSGLTLRERARLITAGSLDSSGDFMHLALQLVAYSPGFLLQCYLLWLDVPRDEREWAMEIMSQPWRPEQNKWGLQQADGVEMIGRFIDQNYEDIRSFFADEVPKLFRRGQQREQEHKDHASGSGQSKQ